MELPRRQTQRKADIFHAHLLIAMYSSSKPVVYCKYLFDSVG
jgi:hypothetical protein